MKNSELSRFMTGKMRFMEQQGSSHTSFTIVSGESVLQLPITVRLCRGSGEVTKRVERSTSRDMGLAGDALAVAVSCRLRRSCVLLCHLIAVVDCVVRRHRDTPDPIVQREYREAVSRVCGSVEAILDDLEGIGGDIEAKPWSKQELTALGYAIKRTDDPAWHPLASGLAERFRQWSLRV